MIGSSLFLSWQWPRHKRYLNVKCANRLINLCSWHIEYVNYINWSCFVNLMEQRVSCSTFNIQVTFMSWPLPGQKQWSAIHTYWKNILRCFSRGGGEDMSVTWMLGLAWNLELPRTCWLKDQLFISNQKPWHCHSVRAQVVISNINQYRGGDGIWVEMLEMTTETYL